MPSSKPVWPGFWTIDELESVKASLSASKWNAQWQQSPVSQEGSIIKREWWQVWEEKDIPDLHHIIQSYDTAFSKRETADYSAITTWGVFYPKANNVPHLILMDAKRGRWDFPELNHDDLVDSMTQAVMRFRQGNFLRLKDDYVDDPTPKIQKEYY
jgi:phage terminase large subunit-like protein